jgi:hypothetical protein
MAPATRFFTLDFKNWPDEEQELRKPLNRLMPFHRIRVPEKQWIKNRKLFQSHIISGDGYSVGARSTSDYDAKFGEDLGNDLADFIKNVFPPLKVLGAISVITSRGLAAILRVIGLKQLGDDIDNKDIFVELFKFVGNRLDALIVDSFIHSVPAWVPTFDETLHPDIQVLELDGVLIRSHQRYDSLPLWQWHRWYDWRFFVIPSPLFNEIVGFGNAHRDDDNAALEKLRDDGHFKLIPYYREGVPVNVTVPRETGIECEWDIGALGGAHSPDSDKEIDNPGPFFDELQPTRSPHDWCWPMTGMFFWAIGRSVYDCSHATAQKGTRVPRGKRKPAGSQFSDEERLERGVHLNQLHPLKAMATARWEAFKFKENPKPVPAIQFMFCANNQLSSAGFSQRPTTSDDPERRLHKSGFPDLRDQDYQFIVDLPPFDFVQPKPEYPVGHTPEFALNTLVLRPRLLFEAKFGSFQNAGGIVEDRDDREKLEITRATDDTGPQPNVQLILRNGQLTQQALVTVPLTKLESSDFNSYGMILSMGWLDPNAAQARKVKKVTVRLVAIQPGGDLHEGLSAAEWNINIGVNGRWFQFRFEAKKNEKMDISAAILGTPQKPAPPVEIEMLLSVDDFVMVSAHGMEEDPFDGLMRKPPEFKHGTQRPSKEAPKTRLEEILKDPKATFDELRARLLDGFGLKDRLLRSELRLDIPTGLPDPVTQKRPTKEVSMPLIGREFDWENDIDTDDKTAASLTARALLLRLFIGNHVDANDLLGLIDPNFPDPGRKNPTLSEPRLQDDGDTPNPLLVQDLLDEVGPGGTKKCRLSAYATEIVGRMGTMAYDPQKLDYVFFYDIKVEDLPQ